MKNVRTLRLPHIFSDGMVLQREKEIKVWGYITSKEKVTLQFMGQTYETIGNDEGKWNVTIPPQMAGGPYEMKIEAVNQCIIVKDILVGDLWICGGQSNMELPVGRVMELSRDEVNGYENQLIRTIKPPIQYNFTNPSEDLTGGEWKAVTKDDVLEFSAVGYFFARELFERYQVPIGLVNVALGGTPAEAWISREELSEFPIYLEAADEYKAEKTVEAAMKADAERIQAWEAHTNQFDRGLVEGKEWFRTESTLEGWSTCNLPGFLNEEVIEFSAGVVWFRKEFEVSEEMLQEDARVLLGTIIDRDSVYVNGEKIGETSYRFPPRIYSIPKGLLKKGKNTIVIRVTFNENIIGFTTGKLHGVQSPNHYIDLEGEWFYQVGMQTTKLDPQLFLQYKPIGVYNGMIEPLKHMSPKGVIWYQGESNTGEPDHYKVLFEKVIKTWRKLFQDENLPFLYAQLANLNVAKLIEVDSGWAKVRQGQLEVLELDNVGMSVTMDIGEWNDLHPLNKKEVGRRLSLIARAKAYGEDIVYSGPLFKAISRSGNKLILSFEHTGTGMIAKEHPLGGFVISEDGINFYEAIATIEGQKVMVEHEKIEHPIEVRYAWADNPQGANLYNKEGLPASPFKAKLN